MVFNAAYIRPISAAEVQREVYESLDSDRLRLRGAIGIFYDPFDGVLSQIAQDIYVALDLVNVSSSLYTVYRPMTRTLIDSTTDTQTEGTIGATTTAQIAIAVHIRTRPAPMGLEIPPTPFRQAMRIVIPSCNRIVGSPTIYRRY